MQHAMNARVKICISRPKGVKCGRCHPFYSGTFCLTCKLSVYIAVNHNMYTKLIFDFFISHLNPLLVGDVL